MRLWMPMETWTSRLHRASRRGLRGVHVRIPGRNTFAFGMSWGSPGKRGRSSWLAPSRAPAMPNASLNIGPAWQPAHFTTGAMMPPTQPNACPTYRAPTAIAAVPSNIRSARSGSRG